MLTQVTTEKNAILQGLLGDFAVPRFPATPRLVIRQGGSKLEVLIKLRSHFVS